MDLLKATKNQTKTAELMCCGFNVVNKIIHTSTLRGMERRNQKNHSIAHLSLDEKPFKKDHNYVSVLINPDGGYAIEVKDGRGKSP